MSDAKNIQEKAVEENAVDNKDKELLLKLQKPVTFDGKEYKEIDLSGLRDLRAKDLIRARRMFLANGNSMDVYAERTVEFACYIANIVTSKPVSLFEDLYAADAYELRNMVIDFF